MRPFLRLDAQFALFSTLLTSSTVSAIRCSELVVDGHKFNLWELRGPHSVVTSEHTPPTFTNTTYTLDICQPLKRSSDVKPADECPNGSYACAIERVIRDDDPKQDSISHVIPIAGDLRDYGGKDLSYQATRLSTSDSNSDSQKQGLRLVLNGGAYPLDAKPGQRREQKAIIEFECDPNRTGLEGEWDPEDKYVPGEGNSDEGVARRDGAADGDNPTTPPHVDGKKQLLKENAALIWQSYGPMQDDKDVDVLRLTWYTKYACEKRSDDVDRGSAGWGFFTWLVILVFLATASYLIFGSWLNYNRYGARGWDLLPHGDTLRDIPYLMKDWLRKVLNTVQGSGSRGGYSAV